MTLHTALSIAYASAVLGLLAIEAREAILVRLHGEVMPEPAKLAIVNQPPGEEVGEWYLAQV